MTVKRFPQVGIAGFILLFSLFNATLFQWPLYRLALASRTALDRDTVLAVVTLFVLQLVVTVAILGLFALVSSRLAKALCVLFTVGNAVALYFIVQYGIVIDATM